MSRSGRSSSWRRPVEPLAYESGNAFRVASDARFVPPQRMYGPADVHPPSWPEELRSFALARPQQRYPTAEQAIATANGWTVLTGVPPATFGDLSFAEVTHLLQCPSVFIGHDGKCAALLVYGVLLSGIVSSLGDVIIDLLPWPETAFLVRPAPKSEVPA